MMMEIDAEVEQQLHEEEEEPATATPTRPARLSIQEQWRQLIEKTLSQFVHASPLKNISTNLSPDHYGNMSPFLVKEVLRMSNAIDGVKMALQTVLETMNDTCKEATHRIMSEQADFKTRQSITLLCETLVMPSMTLADLEENDDLRARTPLQVQHVLENDKHRKWLPLYRYARAETINVFTVKIGPGLGKATPETGRYVVSVLMPLHASVYRLCSITESYSQNYEELNAAYRKALIDLNAYKRLYEHDKATTGKRTTLPEQAAEMAVQIQNKQLSSLKIHSDEQAIQIAMLSRQVEEFNRIMSGPDQLELASMNETILILRDKIQESRERNLKLENRLHEHGISTDISWKPGQPKFNTKKALAEFKQRKQLRREVALRELNKRNTASSTSSSYQESSSSDSYSSSKSESASSSISQDEEESDNDDDDDDLSE